VSAEAGTAQDTINRMETRELSLFLQHSTLVDSEQQLLELIAREIRSTGERQVVIMAGHFMLFMDPELGRLVPGILEEQQSEGMRTRVAQRVGIFPTYTWQLGLQLAEDCASTDRSFSFLLLINDWQYVPSSGSASELRQAYFEKFSALPESYANALTQRGFSPDQLIGSRKHPLAFPETWLKYRFQKKAKRLVDSGKLTKRVLDAGRNDTEVSFENRDGSSMPLISCGVTGCSGEITEMIAEVFGAGYRFLVLFAPGECYESVRNGAEIALNLHELVGMKVVIADAGGSGEMTREAIYSKLVHVTVLEMSPT
jgi:hypothetical protein